MNPRLPILISAFLLSSAVAAQSGAWFRKLDRNNDGYLQRAEVKSLRGVSNAFDEADANHDGRLDPAEFITAERITQNAKLPPFPQDSAVAEQVKAELAREPELKDKQLEVKTHRGRVRLSGTVDDENQRLSAVKAAADIVGTANVGDVIRLR